jgi:hypothetical protein
LNGEPLLVEMIVQDLNKNGAFDILNDRILVGHITSGGLRRWAGTAFILDFMQSALESKLPNPGDIYQIKFKRPFWRQDSLVFVVDPEGIGVEKNNAIPLRTELLPNYPNPFNPQTMIAYTVSRPAHVTLAVYNVLGQRVATLVDRFQEPGAHSITWRGRSFSAGLYFCTFKAGSFTQVRKMMMVR